MKLHEGHEFMEKILRANDFSRRLRTVLLRAALRVLKSMHRRQANAFISWRLLASNDDPWRQAEKYRWQAQRIATFNLMQHLQGHVERMKIKIFLWWKSVAQEIVLRANKMRRIICQMSCRYRLSALKRWQSIVNMIVSKQTVQKLTATTKELHTSLGQLRLRNDHAEVRIAELNVIVNGMRKSFKAQQLKGADRHRAAWNRRSVSRVILLWIRNTKFRAILRRSIDRLAKRLFTRLLHSAFYILHLAFKAAMFSDCICLRSLDDLRNRSFNNWKCYYSKKSKRRLRLFAYVKRWKLVHLVHVFVAWHCASRASRQRRMHLKKIISHSNQCLKACALRFWQQFSVIRFYSILQRTEETVKLARFSRKHLHLEVESIFNSWIAFRRWWHEAKKTIHRLFYRFRLEAFAKTMMQWNRFVVNTKLQCRMASRLSKFVAKLDRRRKLHVFFSWLRVVDTRCHANNFFCQILHRLCKQIMVRFMARWSKHIIALICAENVLVLKEKQQRQTNIWLKRFDSTVIRCKLLLVLNSWKRFRILQQRAKGLLYQLIRKHANSLIGKGIDLWKYQINRKHIVQKQKAKVNQLIYKCKNRNTILVFFSWIQLIDSKRKAKALIGRIFKKLNNRSKMTAMNTWNIKLDLAAKQREEAVRLARFASKMKHREAMRVFCSWLDFVAWRRDGKVLLRRVLRRLDNGLIFHFFSEWERCCNSILLMKNGVEKGSRILHRINIRKVEHRLRVWINKGNVLQGQRLQLIRLVNNKKSSICKLTMKRLQHHSNYIRRFQEDAVRLQRFAIKLAESQIFQVFASWTMFVEQRHYFKKLVYVIFRRLATMAVGGGMMIWKQFLQKIGWQREKLHRISHIMRRFKRREELRIFEVWLGHLEYQNKVKRMLMYVFRCFKNLATKGAIVKWRQFIRNIECENAKIIIAMRFASKRRHSEIARVFFSWLDVLYSFLCTKKCLHKLLCRRKRILITKGLMSWKNSSVIALRREAESHFHEECSRKKVSDKAKLIGRIHTELSRIRRRVFLMLRVNISKAREERRRVLVFLDRARKRKVAFIWTTWRLLMGQRRDIRTLLVRITSMKNRTILTYAVSQWKKVKSMEVKYAHLVCIASYRLHARILRGGRKCLMAWQDYVAETLCRKRFLVNWCEVRRRRLLSSAMRCWFRNVMKCVLAILHDFAKHKSSLLMQQSLVAIFVAKYYRAVYALLSRGFYQWRSHSVAVQVQKQMSAITDTLNVSNNAKLNIQKI